MAIESGNSAEANDVLNMMGIMFKNYAQILYDSDYNAFATNLNTNATLNSKNQYYSTHVQDDMTDTGMFYDGTADKYVGPLLDAELDASFAVIDDHDDASVDLAIWDIVGDVFESGGFLTVRDNTIGGTVSTAITDNVLSSTYSNYIRIRIRANHSGASGISNVQVGSTLVFTPPNDNTFYNLDILIEDGIIYAFDTSASNWALKGAVGNGLLRYTANNTGDNQLLEIDFTRFWNFTATPLTIPALQLITAHVAPATMTNAIGTFNAQIIDPTMALSADNGTTFETVTDATIHRFTVTGTQLKTRFQWTGAVSDSFSLSEHAVMYNWY